MNKQRQDDQLEPTYTSSVPISDVALKTNQKQWTIEKGGKKGSGISMLMMICIYAKLYCCLFVFLYKIDLALNNLKWLICHKTQPTNLNRVYH